MLGFVFPSSRAISLYYGVPRLLVRFGARFIRASLTRQIPISRFVADPPSTNRPPFAQWRTGALSYEGT